MKLPLYSIFLILLLCVLSLTASAQTTASITTLPLEVSAVCPGSVIAVPFTYTGSINKFEAQIASDNSFTALDAPNDVNSNTDWGYIQNDLVYWIYAQLPPSLKENKPYRIRVISNEPTRIESFSSVPLIIKHETKPPRLILDSLTLECTRGSANDWAGRIYIDHIPGAKLKMYDDKGQNLNYYFNRIRAGWSYTEFAKPLYIGPPKYPLYESDYYFTQTIGECESEKVKTTYRMRVRASAFTLDEFVYCAPPCFGRVRYCQGDTAVPLNQKGYTPDNPNLYIQFGLYQSTTPFSTTVIPTPNTDQPNYRAYTLTSVPYDRTLVCGPIYYSVLEVSVAPRPTAPTVPTPTLTYYKYQPAVALTATASSTATTLRWYLPDATGVSSLTSATAPVPPTDKPGSFTYLVSQVQGNCESSRYPITVNVSADTPVLSELITVYPVPASAFLTVAIASQLQRIRPAIIELIDTSGQVVWQHETRESQLLVPLQSVKTGTYSLRIRIGEQQAVKRLIKL